MSTRPANDGFDVFVSYAGEDRAWAEGYLVPALGSSARILTPAQFRIGASIRDELERAVSSSRFTVLVLSPSYSKDEWSAFSEQLASYLSVAAQQTRLIPLVLKPCDLPLSIAFRVSLDCKDPASWESEIGRLRALLAQPEQPQERIPCPYPGMTPFGGESRFFFGREAEIDDIVTRLRHQNYLWVIGPSGCGKSSLVFAGVGPELRKRQPGIWSVKSLRPVEVLGNSGVILDKAWVRASLDHDPGTRRLLLIVDQLEELFTQAEKSQQNAFITAMKELRASEVCSILFTMNAGFYSDLLSSGFWPLTESERKDIGSLPGASLREAIARPAEACGVYPEPALVERILADGADEPGVLPAMQEALVLLWEKMERRFLSLRSYEELGKGGANGITVALAIKAGGVISGLSEPQRTIARRIFVRLVQFGEGRTDTRRQQLVSKLYCEGDDRADFQRTLAALEAGRLIILGGDPSHSDTRVDISHEALISGWPDLQTWLTQHKQAELIRRRLERKTEDWVQLGRKSGGLLDAAELPEAERWLASPDARDLGYDVELPNLVRASRRALRIRRLLVAAVAVIFVVIIAAGVWALLRSQRFMEADREANEVIVELPRNVTNPALSLLKALHAVSLTYVHDGAARLEPLRALHLAIQAYKIPVIFSANNVHLAFSRDGTRLAAAGKGVLADPDQPRLPEGVALWSFASHQKLLPQLLPGHAAAFRGDGLRLATGCADGSTFVWDAGSGGKLLALAGQTGTTEALAFSPDQKLIAAATVEGTITLWDAESGRAIRTLLPAHDNAIMAVAFSSDGRMVASAGWDGYTGIWDVFSGANVGFLKAHKEALTAVAFRPGHKQLATTSNTDPNVKLLDLDSGRAITFQGDKEGNTSVAFSPDGAKLAAGNHDGMARVWDANNGRQLLVLSHPGTVYDVVFPDNRRLVTAALSSSAENADIREYLLNTQALIAEGVSLLNRPLTAEECRSNLLSKNCR